MTVSTVRLLIADPENFDRVVATGDGFTTIFSLPNTPVVSSSQTVYVNGVQQTPGSQYTIDLGTGVIVFGTPPPLGESISVLYRWTFLSDANLSDLLTLVGDDDRLAAAQALDIIASSEALIQKQITHLNLTTNGPAVAKALREHAKELRRQVDEGEGDAEGLFDIAEMVLGSQTAREKVWKEALRGQDL